MYLGGLRRGYVRHIVSCVTRLSWDRLVERVASFTHLGHAPMDGTLCIYTAWDLMEHGKTSPRMSTVNRITWYNHRPLIQ